MPIHGVKGAEDGQGEGCVGQGVLAAPHHVHAVADPVGTHFASLQTSAGGRGLCT